MRSNRVEGTIKGVKNTTKLNTKVLAIILGTILLLISIVANLTGYYLHNVAEFLMSIYLGYGLDFMDIIISMVWVFFYRSHCWPCDCLAV